MKTTLIITLIVAASWSAIGQTAEDPRPGRRDARIQTLNYTAGEVYHIKTRYNQESMIKFGQTEQIVHVGVGDPLAWQAVPVNNYLMLKPTMDDADTNMNILTQDSQSGETRSYAFQLDALEDKGNERGLWQLSFRYPKKELLEVLAAQPKHKRPAKNQSAMEPSQLNFNYQWSGDKALVPEHVMDDGTFTYFTFKKSQTLPAIFAVNEDGSESLVNWHIKDYYLVVERTAASFVLRLDKLATQVYNDG